MTRRVSRMENQAVLVESTMVKDYNSRHWKFGKINEKETSKLPRFTKTTNECLLNKFASPSLSCSCEKLEVRSYEIKLEVEYIHLKLLKACHSVQHEKAFTKLWERGKFFNCPSLPIHAEARGKQRELDIRDERIPNSSFNFKKLKWKSWEKKGKLFRKIIFHKSLGRLIISLSMPLDSRVSSTSSYKNRKPFFGWNEMSFYLHLEAWKSFSCV